MKVYAAILAAGSGMRFGGDKALMDLAGMPLWRWSYETYLRHPLLAGTGVVASPSNIEAVRAESQEAAFVVLGGATRQDSSKAALDALPSDAEMLLLHDAARPFVSADLIERVIEAASEAGAAAPAVPVVDTIKEFRDAGVSTLDRSSLVSMQTPQAIRVDLLKRAYEGLTDVHTDDLSLVEALGIQPRLVQGEESNFKITTSLDAAIARGLLAAETRTGLGYDVHAFSQEEDRPLYLGGVHFPDQRGLKGHSDADALLHAIVDSILGAANLGDIGTHFPPSDEAWRNKRSTAFLEGAAGFIRAAGWRILNVDATVIAESPKVMARADEMKCLIGASLGIAASRISIKATTNERLGFVGRGEGIAALAIATLTRAGRS